MFSLSFPFHQLFTQKKTNYTKLLLPFRNPYGMHEMHGSIEIPCNLTKDWSK
jgi:hypothetical protein